HAAERLYEVIEVLTDSSGEFSIPKQTFVPSVGRVNNEPLIFIYAPGYGPFPWFHRNPQGQAQVEAFRTHTVVELVRGKDRQERREFWRKASGEASDLTYRRAPNLVRLANQEAVALGFEPSGTKER